MKSKSKKELIKKVYFTVLYFNHLNFTPTSFEVWKYFINFDGVSGEACFSDVIEALKILREKEKIFETDGFWSIKTKKIIGQRVLLQKYSLNKLKKVKRWTNFIQLVPFIEGIFVSGTLAFRNAEKESDWDVLVITTGNRIWLGRFLLTTFLFLMGVKRHRTEIKDRFCLNHFLADKNLIPRERNVYVALEINFLFPVFGKKVFLDFLKINKFWSKKIILNSEFFLNTKNGLEPEKNRIVSWLEKSLEISGLAKLLNRMLKRMMIKRIKNNSLTFKEGGVIIYNDREQAFWPDYDNKINFKKIIEGF